MTKAKLPEGPHSERGSAGATHSTKSECAKKRVVVIDPGHGGTQNVGGSSFNNATSVSGPLEKQLTLEFAQSLRRQMQTDEVRAILAAKDICETEVILTRETDVNLTASARVAVATDNKADILASIHFNGGVAEARGTETFYKDAANPEQSNEAEDKALAQAVNDAMVEALRKLDKGAKNRGAKPDTQTKLKSLGVLRDPGVGLSGKMCRSILIEVEFITNPAVDLLLVSGKDASANRDAVMGAAARALARILE